MHEVMCVFKSVLIFWFTFKSFNTQVFTITNSSQQYHQFLRANFVIFNPDNFEINLILFWAFSYMTFIYLFCRWHNSSDEKSTNVSWTMFSLSSFRRRTIVYGEVVFLSGQKFFVPVVFLVKILLFTYHIL